MNPSSRGPRTYPVEPVPTTTGTVSLESSRDDPEAVTVLVNGVPSSYINRSDPGDVGFEYLEVMLTVIQSLDPGPLRVLHLGAAGCTLARAIDHLRPGSRQLAVDVDAELLQLARAWFDLPRSPALRLRHGDAREILASLRDASYDVVVRDAFAPDVTPAHLSTVEFDREVARTLRPGGLYLANVADRPPLTLSCREVRSVHTAFAGRGAVVSLIAEPSLLRGRGYGNLVVAATTAPRDSPEPDTVTPSSVIHSPALARQLRSLAAPTRILVGTDLPSAASTAPLLTDN